jgi:hypothetical protein
MMNKKEQAEVAELRRQLAIARALRFTDPIEPDLGIPDSFQRVVNGWDFHIPAVDGLRVEKACASSISHSWGNWDKTTTQGPCRLYSTELLAAMAARSVLAMNCAEALAKADAKIEALRAA